MPPADPMEFGAQPPSLPIAAVAPEQLDACSDEALDGLPYGVICLDPAGRILRYNLAESRLARLDRAQVLGRTFFGEIAPCTTTPEFQGRFQQFVRPGAGEPSVRFEYVFDFKFGAQAVEVEIHRSPSPQRTYVLIRRRRFLEKRAVPDATLAPLQRDLAPDEAAVGVLRSADERRRVHVSPAFFASLRATWQRVAPRAWPTFCDEWGFQLGRLAVVDLETEGLERTERALRELSMTQVMDLVAVYLEREGWGRLTVDFSAARRGAFVLSIERCAIAEAVGVSEVPRCQLLAGFFRAIFCHLANKLLVVREVCCKSQGLDRCRFIVVAEERREALVAAIAESDADVAKALAALGGR